MRSNSNPSPSTLLFDLDGTLIDSAPSILSTLASILTQQNLTPVIPLQATLIGPPLRVTLQRITGCADADCIERLVDAFRVRYDSSGYQQTVVYPGIDDALCSLTANGQQLFIVTNKRLHPTLRILEWLNWTQLFAGVYTLDATTPAAESKSVVISRLLAAQQLQAAALRLIGDTLEDAHAASVNGIQFIGVRWGYGQLTPDILPETRLLNYPLELATLG